MEPISFAVSVIPLFHSCLQYFQLFKTAESASLDVQILLFQLDCHHEDLIIWGEKHGVFDEIQPRVSMPEEVFSRLETALRLLEALFKDTHALRERYGVVESNDGGESATTGQDTAFPSSAGLRRLNWFRSQKANSGREQSAKPSLGVLRKTQWAIYDKEKFEGLVQKIGEVVGQVEKILPVPDEFRNQTALRDIVPLIEDLARLKLFQTASASIRPAWSNAASGLIIASEAASVRGPGTISRWIEQVDDGESRLEDNPLPHQIATASTNNAKTPQNKPKELSFEIEYRSLWSLWFAFLPNCPSSSLGLSCATRFLEINADCPAFINVEDAKKTWGLGPKIKRALQKDPDIGKYEETLDKVSNISYELQDKVADLLDPITAGLRAQSTLHIYCPPCRCAIRTALILCHQGLSGGKAWVRVDDRIPTTCCDAQDTAQLLQSFIETINAYELDQKNVFPSGSYRGDVEYMDKEWIENRVYTLQVDLYAGEAHEDRFKNFESCLRDMEKGEGIHSVVLVEASSGAWILQTAPFRKSPRMPKQTEVYSYRCPKVVYSWNNRFEDKGIYRGTFTPSDLVFPHQDYETSRKRPRQDEGDSRV